MTEVLDVFFADFGVPVVLFPDTDQERATDASGRPLLGLFNNGYLPITTAQSDVPLASTGPHVLMKSADVAEVKQDDKLLVDGTLYAVEIPQPDGTGLTLLELLEA